MVCEICGQKMEWFVEKSTQGWRCPECGWNVVTTYIEEIYLDGTEYSLYIEGVTEIDKEKIKFVAKTANVNFILARRMLQEKETCILKAKAPEMKAVIPELKRLNINFNITPVFRYE